MDKQTREARESVKEMDFKGKLKHFWYYYKIHTIATVVGLSLIIGTIYSAVTAVKYDLEIVYYGNRNFTEEQVNEVKSYLSGVIKDIDNNGEVNVNFIVNTSKVGEGSQYEMAMRQKFQVELSAAAYSSYIVAEGYYKALSSNEVMESSLPIEDSEKLSSILGTSDSDKEYWCTRSVYETEKGNKKKLLLHDNAQLAYEALASNKTK